MNIQATLSKYPKLTKASFPGMRDSVCPEKLALLAEQVEKIPLLDLMGTVVDANHYLQAYTLLFHSTIGPRIQGYFFLKNILPRIHDKKRMLDVGVGDGTFLKWYARNFAEVCVVDNNKAVLDNFNNVKKILPTRVKVEKVFGAIEDIVLPKNSFNLCTLTHVLYHIPKEKWLAVIDNVYHALVQDGIIAIVFDDGYQGKDQLLRDFGGKPLIIADFVAECLKKYGKNCEIYRIEEDYHAKSLRHMLHIASFLLMDINATANKNEMEKYVMDNYWCDGHFIMSSEAKVVLITRK
jgi:2-polyprenyl-3-methyl-5-hydroxy-6-metoxy-1,4-benzoquinol methylase